MVLKEDIERVRRLEHIASILFKNELHYAIEILNLKMHLPWSKKLKLRKNMPTQAKVISKAFIELGGAFIKLGQMISMRPDLVGKETSQAFESMLDNVPAEKPEAIMHQIDRSIFKEFDHNPLAAGSIAQVHKAILKDGQRVAVKIKRPGIDEIFKEDIALMKVLAQELDSRNVLQFASAKDIVEEFEKYTRKELDLNHEIANMQKFRRNFSSEKRVVIPKVYAEHSNDHVIIMELLEGEKLIDVSLTAKQKDFVTRTVFDMMFKQLFEDGLFHADIHAGNLILLKGPRLGIFDFGIVGYLDAETKSKLTTLFIAMVEGDLEGICDSLIDINIGKNVPNKLALKEGIYYTLGDYYDTSLDKMPVGQMFNSAIDTAVKAKLRFPGQLVLFGKSLMTMEGFCSSIDPEFNIVQEARPFIKKLMIKKANPIRIAKEGINSAIAFKNLIFKTPKMIKDFSDQMRIIEDSVAEFDSQFKGFQQLMIKMTKALIFGLLLATFLISATLSISANPRLWNMSLFSLVGYFMALLLSVMIYLTLKD